MKQRSKNLVTVPGGCHVMATFTGQKAKSRSGFPRSGSGFFKRSWHQARLALELVLNANRVSFVLDFAHQSASVILGSVHTCIQEGAFGQVVLAGQT
jgi:hypothetical protein